MPPGLLWKKTIAKIFFFSPSFFMHTGSFQGIPPRPPANLFPSCWWIWEEKKRQMRVGEKNVRAFLPPPHFILKKRGRIIFERGEKKMSSRFKVASFSLPTSRISSYGSMLVNRWLWILFKYKKGRMTCMYLKMRICSSPSDDDTPHSCNTIWKRLGVIKESLCLNWNFLFFYAGVLS